MTTGSAYIFPSQVPLTRSLADRCISIPGVRVLLDIAGDTLGHDIVEWLKTSSDSELQDQKYRRPVINCISLGCYRMDRMVSDRRPAVFAGMSLGMLTAAAAAGCLSVEEMVRISSLQATVESEHFANTDFVSVFFISGDVEAVYRELSREDLDHLLHFSARASSDQFLAGARLSDLARMSEPLARAGALPRPIPDSFPGHCDLMGGVKTDFESRWTPQDPLQNLSVPLLTVTEARPITSAEQMRQCIIEQYTKPMDWRACVSYLQSLHLDDYVLLEPSSFIGKSLEIDPEVTFALRVAGLGDED